MRWCTNRFESAINKHCRKRGKQNKANVPLCLNTVLWKSTGSAGKTPYIPVLMSVLDYERQVSLSGRFISGAELPVNHWIGGWADQKAGRPRHISWEQTSLSLSGVESQPWSVYIVSLLTGISLTLSSVIFPDPNKKSLLFIGE
jgi:hypothetical protein